MVATVVLISGFSHAAFADSWYFDGPHGDNTARDVAVDPAGNIYVAVCSYNELDDSYYVLKYTPYGELLWQKEVPDTLGLTVDAGGNVYLTGTTSSDVFTSKYDTNGNEIWTSYYDNGSYTASGSAIALDADGNVYVTGRSSNSQNDDIIMIKYSSRGREMMVNHYDGGSVDYGRGIGVDGAGDIYVAGTSHNGSDYDIVTIKYTAKKGEEAWVAVYDTGAPDSGSGLAIDSNGDIQVSGTDTITYDAAGNLVRVLDANASAIDADQAGNIYLVGSSHNGTDPDILSSVYDSSGTLVRTETFDNGGIEYGLAVAAGDYGNFVSVGWGRDASNWYSSSVFIITY